MKTYEAMFLLDAGAPDFETAAAPVRDVLARAQAEILSLKPWDERRLTYEIKGRKRALYALTYFKADPARLQELQHDIQLDERIVRAMVFSGDDVTEAQIKAETPMTSGLRRPSGPGDVGAPGAVAPKPQAVAVAEAPAAAEGAPAEAPAPEAPAAESPAEPKP